MNSSCDTDLQINSGKLTKRQIQKVDKIIRDLKKKELEKSVSKAGKKSVK